MQTTHIKAKAVGLPKGYPISQYVSFDEIKADLKDDMTALVDVVNKYCRQKGPLPEGNDLLADHVEETLKFAPLTEDVKVTKEDGTVVVKKSWTETTAAFINRFVAAVAAGKYQAPGLTITGTKPDERSASAWNALQAVADKFKLRNDVRHVERVPAAKRLPKYAIEGAANIIKNASQAKWVTTFTKEGIPFEPFTVANDPEGNQLRLARAIVERESRQAKPQYA